MNTDVLKKIETKYLREDIPTVNVGDTVELIRIVRDSKGEKRRSQSFKGIIIEKRGSSLRQTITVRKISQGVGVEIIVPLNSPNIEKITILKPGKVRQSNIYYMRGRIGKRAMKIEEGKMRVEKKKAKKSVFAKAEKLKDSEGSANKSTKSENTNKKEKVAEVTKEENSQDLKNPESVKKVEKNKK